MQDLTLSVQSRQVLGKAVRRQLSSQEVPGIIYGKKTPPIPVTADYNTLSHLYKVAGSNKLVDVIVGEEGKPLKVLFHDVQIDPTTNNIRHFDLYAVVMTEKVKTEIPIHVVGESPVIIQQEGILTTVLDTIEIEANPAHIPEKFELDISSFTEVGDSYRVEDLKVPDEVTVLNDPEEVILQLSPKIEEEVIEEPEEAVDAADVPAEHGGTEGEEQAAEADKTEEQAA